MKFEVLKKNHLKRNIIIGVVVVAIISACILTFTRAKYRTTQSIPFVNGTINYSLADLNIVAITVDGESVDTIPDGNYELTENSYCTVDGEEDSSISISYDSNTKTLNVIPFTTKGTKCYLDFKKSLCPEGATACDTILAGKDIEEREDFGTSFTNETTKIIYQTIDWTNQPTYYFAGAPTDNWVSFGGFYWRIIRVNGDGSVRLLYNGTSTTTTGEGTLTKALQKFNKEDDRSEYVGLKYTEGEQHGQTTNSAILTELNSWYTSSNLDDHADHIDTNIGFCSDRTMASGDNWSSRPASLMYYAVRRRIQLDKIPSLQCSSNDIIKVPVGLITADEAMLGGVPYNGNAAGNFLINGQAYWTMSPYYVNLSGSVHMFYVRSDGMLIYWGVDGMLGVRPVINLKADTQFSGGNGTASNPYVVAT